MGATNPPTGQHPSVGATQAVRALGTQALPAVGDEYDGPQRAQSHQALCRRPGPAPGGAGRGHHLPGQLGGLVAHRGEGRTRTSPCPTSPVRTSRRPSRPCSTKASRRRVQTDKTATSTPNTEVIRTVPAKGTTVKKGQRVTLITGAEGPPVHDPRPREPVGHRGQGAVAVDGAAGQRPIQQHLHPTEHRLHAEPEVRLRPSLPGGTVSIFTQSTTTPVPDVIGLGQTTACNRLGQAGFQCGTITTQPSSSVAEERRHQHDPVGRGPGAGQRQREPVGVERAVVGPRPLRHRRHPVPSGVDVAGRGPEPGRGVPARPCRSPRTGWSRPRPPTAVRR